MSQEKETSEEEARRLTRELEKTRAKLGEVSRELAATRELELVLRRELYTYHRVQIEALQERINETKPVAAP